MEHDEFCPERHLAETERCDTAYCLWCATLREARADERRRVWNTVATLRASAKKDENGWALYEHCYECTGAADGYNTAVDDALAAIRGDASRNSDGDIPASRNTGITPDVKDGA